MAAENKTLDDAYLKKLNSLEVRVDDLIKNSEKNLIPDQVAAQILNKEHL